MLRIKKLMPNYSMKLAIVFLFSATLAGCNSARNELKMFMKCGIAANQLGQRNASANISKNLKIFIDKNKIDGSARDAMFLAAEVRDDDLKLYEMNPERKFYTLVKLYNSSACKEIHGQEKLDMPLIPHFRYYLFYLFI